MRTLRDSATNALGERGGRGDGGVDKRGGSGVIRAFVDRVPAHSKETVATGVCDR